MNYSTGIGTDMRANGIDITESLANILIINSGSSSIKFRLSAIVTLLGEQESVSGLSQPDAVGHRVVHGDNEFAAPAFIDDEIITRLEKVSNHWSLHVRGYKEKGNINTPLELAMDNEIDRFSLAIDVINRVPRLQVTGAQVKEKLRDLQIDCRQYAHAHCFDKLEIREWRWLS